MEINETVSSLSFRVIQLVDPDDLVKLWGRLEWKGREKDELSCATSRKVKKNSEALLPVHHIHKNVNFVEYLEGCIVAVPERDDEGK